MCTKRQLKEYLEEISNGAKFTKFDFASAEKFTVSLKCKIEEREADYYNNYTKQWIRKFSDFTNTAWIVHNCFPNLKRLVYRKSFWCHRSAQNKSKSSERTRNLECKAKIDFRVKFINKNTLRNDPDLKEGLNMNISIDFNHSHLVRTPESFNLLKSSSQSDSAFYEYFNDGYTPSIAKCYHELLLIERYGRDSEYIANASMNPNLRHIIYIFQKRGKHSEDEKRIIQRKINALENHTIKYNSDPQFVVIITPLMGRVVTQFCMEHVLIDITKISGGPLVMIVYVPTQVGFLPIACAIYTEQSEDIYGQIFLAISSVRENYGKRFEPKLVSLSNSLVKNALISMYRNIVIKLDRYMICREFWEWICDSVNNIDKDKRHDVMTRFKSLVYANSMEDAIRIHSDLLSNDVMQSCLHKLEYIWQDREQWIASGDFFGINEAPMIFVKEFLIQKCKSFTFCIMMDVVTNILENHFQKMLIAAIDNEVINLHTKFLPKVNIELSSESIQRVGENEFIIACELKKKKFYRLNTDTICCDCKMGAKGRICEHLTGVLNAIETKSAAIVSEDDKDMVLKIAGDVNKIKHELDNFEELNELPIERPISASSKESDFYEMKKEDVDPLDEAHETVATSVDLKVQYEAAMKTVNDEFRRLNKLFKDNPNAANMETMTRLAKELGKIKPVEKVEFSNMFVHLNT